MKTKTIFLMMLVLFISANAYSVKLPTMSIESESDKTATINFDAYTPQNFELTVKTENGEILYYKKGEKPVDNFSTVYNFNKLENGKYDVTLDFGSCSLISHVNVKENNVVFGEVSQNCKPYIQFDDGQLKLSFLNRSQKNVFLNVYQNGEHIDGKKLGKDFCMQKMVDYSKLKKGTYKFVISGEFSDYTFSINK